MIGRDRELGVVRRALSDAKRQGVPVLVRIYGESGVGKTHFLGELAKSAERERWLVLETGCHNVQQHTPFLVSNRITASALEKLGDGTRSYTSGIESGLASFDAAVARRISAKTGPSLDPQSYSLVFLRLVEGIAVDRNIAILCDDAQWIDSESADALMALLQCVSTGCIALIVFDRSTSDSSTRWHSAIQIRLGALDLTHSLRLVRQELQDADEATANAIAHHTAGYPLEILSLCHEIKSGADVDIEHGLRARIAQHLSTLDPQVREFIQLCALLEDPIEHRLLSAFYPDADELSTLVRAAERYIATDGADLRFRHATLAQSVIQSIAVPVPLRKRIINALESLPERDLTDYERVAEQAAACGERRLQTATYEKLAAEAYQRQAWSVVVRSSELAIAGTSATESHDPSFLLRYVVALRAFDREPEAVDLLLRELPKLSKAPPATGDLVATLIGMLIELDRREQAIRFYKTYSLMVDEPAERARLVASAMHAAAEAFDEQLFEELDKAFESVKAFATQRALAGREVARAFVLLANGKLTEARDAIDTAFTHADPTQPRYHDVLAFAAMVTDFRGVGCDAASNRLPNLTSRFRLDAHELFYGKLCEAWNCFYLGDWGRARALVSETYNSTMPVARSAALLAIPAAIAAITGENNDFSKPAESVAHAALEGHYNHSAVQLLPWWLVRHLDSSLENFVEQIATDLVTKPPSPTSIGYVPAGIAIWASLRSRDSVLEQFARNEESRDRSQWGLAHWSLARGLALDALGTRDAKAVLVGAAQRFRTLRAPFLAAFAAYKAAQTTQEEHALLERLGIAKSTKKPPRAGASVDAELTPREWDVARTVGEGATNRQAAEALFLSERTIEVHLSNVFGKLGLSSRAQLVRWLYENQRAS